MMNDRAGDHKITATTGRVAPDRRWFGNTRVIGQGVCVHTSIILLVLCIHLVYKHFVQLQFVMHHIFFIFFSDVAEEEREKLQHCSIDRAMQLYLHALFDSVQIDKSMQFAYSSE
jgi:NGP1NT (NUC091) domain